MYNSLKGWLNLDAQIKPFSSRSGTGAITYGTTRNIKCYAENEVKLVRTSAGAEFTSKLQLYVTGDTTVSEKDSIVFEGIEMPIGSIGTFYRNGLPDLKVVYL